ncbi:MAG: hypothetical protein AAGN82_25700 [Myxococcota bacterium]
MTSRSPFSSLAADTETLDGAVALQSLHGGDLSTSLLEAGVDERQVLAAYASSRVGYAPGPAGRLPEPPASLWAILPPALAVAQRVLPLVHDDDGALGVATPFPLAAGAARRLAETTKVAIVPFAVLPFRLYEALYRHAEGPLAERERWLLALEAAGRPFQRDERERQLRRYIRETPQPGPRYRRMSEHPEGIARSTRQPEAQSLDPDALAAMLSVPARPSEPTPLTRPYDLRSSFTPVASSSPPPPLEHGAGSPVGDDEDDEPHRITQPYADEDTADGTPESEGEASSGDPASDEGEKRDTQPWRDADGTEDDDEEAPVSVSRAFSDTFGGPPEPSERGEATTRQFRHRGPFTRRQAEIAASQAVDVRMLFEVLLRYAQQFFERCLLLVVAEDRAVVRYRHGVVDDRSVSLPLDGAGLLATALRTGDPVVRPFDPDDQGDEALASFLGRPGAAAASVVAIPIAIRERVVAMFYGDDGLDAVHAAAVADVTDFTEVCAAEIPRLILARKQGSEVR